MQPYSNNFSLTLVCYSESVGFSVDSALKWANKLERTVVCLRSMKAHT